MQQHWVSLAALLLLLVSPAGSASLPPLSALAAACESGGALPPVVSSLRGACPCELLSALAAAAADGDGAALRLLSCARAAQLLSACAPAASESTTP